MESCELDNWKEALAALLTYAHPEDFARLCGESLSHINQAAPSLSVAALLAILAPSPHTLFPFQSLLSMFETLSLCLFCPDTLGCRLESERTEKRCLQACLCYICSGNIEKLVECWTSNRDSSSPLGLEVYMEAFFVV